MPGQGFGSRSLSLNQFLETVKRSVTERMTRLLEEIEKEGKEFDNVQVQSASFTIELSDLIDYLKTKDFKNLCEELNEEFGRLKLDVYMSRIFSFDEADIKKLDFKKPKQKTFFGKCSRPGRCLEVQFHELMDVSVYMNITYTPVKVRQTA